MIKVWPLPLLPDLRRPYVTSSFKTRNHSRPNHDGVDLFYRWRASDGPVKLGDGGAARDWTKPGAPAKWFIPDDTPVIAPAAGIVQIAGKIGTGWRVWIVHKDGVRTGHFHLRRLDVQVGQEVSLGFPLGLPGDNPRDKDARHLHFETSPVGRYEPTDPELWLADATFFALD